jgi:hypothetical protein
VTAGFGLQLPHPVRQRPDQINEDDDQGLESGVFRPLVPGHDLGREGVKLIVIAAAYYTTARIQ